MTSNVKKVRRIFFHADFKKKILGKNTDFGLRSEDRLLVEKSFNLRLTMTENLSKFFSQFGSRPANQSISRFEFSKFQIFFQNSVILKKCTATQVSFQFYSTRQRQRVIKLETQASDWLIKRPIKSVFRNKFI